MKDNRLEDMKVDYKTIKIPEELRQRVDMGIEQAKKEKEEEKGMRQKSKVLVFTKRAAGKSMIYVNI